MVKAKENKFWVLIGLVIILGTVGIALTIQTEDKVWTEYTDEQNNIHLTNIQMLKTENTIVIEKLKTNNKEDIENLKSENKINIDRIRIEHKEDIEKIKDEHKTNIDNISGSDLDDLQRKYYEGVYNTCIAFSLQQDRCGEFIKELVTKGLYHVPAARGWDWDEFRNGTTDQPLKQNLKQS